MWAPYWAHIIGNHLGLDPEFLAPQASVTLSSVLFALATRCAYPEGLSIQCLQLQQVVRECFTNKIWPQPHCIKHAQKFKLPCILN